MSGLVRPSALIATALALAACGSASAPAPTSDNLAQAVPSDVEDVPADGLTAAPDSIHDRESMGSGNTADESGR